MTDIPAPDDGQLTLEDDNNLFDPAPMEWKDRPGQHGWDNPTDVERAKDWLIARRGMILRKDGASERILGFAQAMRDFGISHRLAGDMIIRQAQPPLEEATIRNVIERFYEMAMSLPGANSLAGGPTRDEKDVGTTWPRPVEYDPREHAAKNTEAFLAQRPGKLISSDAVLYARDGDIWREVSDRELQAEIRATDPRLILDTKRIQTMSQEVHIARFTKARPFEWIDPPDDAPAANDLILFRNGMLDFNTGDLRPHTDRYFATSIPDFDYDPAATCPLWMAKLGEWLAPSFHDTLAEFMGYMLTPDTRIQMFLAMIGATGGGKGTIMRVMEGLVSPPLRTSRTLNDLGGDFGLQGTADKRLIFIPDAHDAKVGNRGVVLDRLKCITGDDALSINRKFKPPMTARVPAKIVMVANRSPKFLDESGALAARQLMVTFSKSFRGTDRMDPDLSDKLRAELSGIANWALEGLQRLRFNGNAFTIGAEGRAASRDLAESQSPALRFANDCLIVTGDVKDRVTLPDVYRAYEAWTLDEGLSGREHRNRDDFKHDILAALGTKGVHFGKRRWHDPEKPRWKKHGKGRVVRGFFGFKLKRVAE